MWGYTHPRQVIDEIAGLTPMFAGVTWDRLEGYDSLQWPVAEDGTPTGDVETCTAIHGEAFSGAYLATGCKEGILTVKAGSDGPEFAMLEYPPSS